MMSRSKLSFGDSEQVSERDNPTTTTTTTTTTTHLGFHQSHKYKAGDDEDEAASSDSSSIGRPDDDDSDDDDDDNQVQSTLSLDSLEDSLPIKKGLSKYYAGKSKSFGNLAQVTNVTEMVKSDNPFNKRRRTLMAGNLMMIKMTSKNKSAFYAHSNHISMPLLPLLEQQHEDDQDDHRHHVNVNVDVEYSCGSYQYPPRPVNHISSLASASGASNSSLARGHQYQHFPQQQSPLGFAITSTTSTSSSNVSDDDSTV